MSACQFVFYHFFPCEVIDFCLVKELVLDKLTNFQSLKLQWASKASLTQRKGRAGRVSEGRCFRLITEQFYVGLYNFSEPEIKVCSFKLMIKIIYSLINIHANQFISAEKLFCIFFFFLCVCVASSY